MPNRNLEISNMAPKTSISRFWSKSSSCCEVRLKGLERYWCTNFRFCLRNVVSEFWGAPRNIMEPPNPPPSCPRALPPPPLPICTYISLPLFFFLFLVLSGSFFLSLSRDVSLFFFSLALSFSLFLTLLLCLCRTFVPFSSLHRSRTRVYLSLSLSLSGTVRMARLLSVKGLALSLSRALLA